MIDFVFIDAIKQRWKADFQSISHRIDNVDGYFIAGFVSDVMNEMGDKKPAPERFPAKSAEQIAKDKREAQAIIDAANAYCGPMPVVSLRDAMLTVPERNKVTCPTCAGKNSDKCTDCQGFGTVYSCDDNWKGGETYKERCPFCRTAGMKKEGSGKDAELLVCWTCHGLGWLLHTASYPIKVKLKESVKPKR